MRNSPVDELGSFGHLTETPAHLKGKPCSGPHTLRKASVEPGNPFRQDLRRAPSSRMNQRAQPMQENDGTMAEHGITACPDQWVETASLGGEALRPVTIDILGFFVHRRRDNGKKNVPGLSQQQA